MFSPTLSRQASDYLLLAILAAISLLVFLVRHFGKPEMLATLMLLAPLALYLAAMYSGQILLIGPATLPINIQNHLFQARLGAACVAPAAIFIATLVSSLPVGKICRRSIFSW